MAVQAGTAFIPVKADMSQFQSGVDTGTKKAGSSIARFAKGAAVAMAGVFAARAVKDFFGGAIEGARESAKVTALTEAAIKSMGGAAGLSAKQVADMSGRLSGLTGIDDEIIQGGANLLLTFGNITSKGGVFDKTLALANDMSVALGQDMKSSSIQLGKALNDPIRGVTALTRVGVSFTEQQKEQIKTLAQSGDLIGAQGIILEEVGRQFGGAAAAAATPMDRLRVTVGNLQESLGARLIPVMDTVATFLANNLPAALDFAGKVFGTVGGAVADFGIRFSGVFAAVRSTVETVVRIVGGLLDTFRSNHDQAAVGVGAAGDRIRGILNRLRATFESIFAAVRVLIEVWVAVVTNLWDRFGTHVLEFARRTLDNLMQAFSGALTAIQGIFELFAGIFTGDWSRAWEGIQQIFSGVWNLILGLGKQFLNLLNLAIGVGMALISAAWSLAWNALKTFVGNVWNGIKDAASAGLATVVQFVRDLPGRLVEAGKALVNAGLQLGKNFVEGILEAIKRLPGALGDMIRNIKLPKINLPDLNPFGDGPGKSIGGKALSRVRSVLPKGAYVTSTYRTPAENRRVGGSPTSYHLDRNNPAVDIGGPTRVLDALHARLRAMGGWRELLWRVKGHYDHIHAAHTGGHVTRHGITPLRPDEILTKLQEGETVLPKSQSTATIDPDAMGRQVAHVAYAVLMQKLRTT